jgi:predicted ATPase
MITKIEALNFRCLRYISQPLDSFQILVGPNASGKTTFLDVISFLNKLLSSGLDEAIYERTSNFENLLWMGQGNRFELAIEAKIPVNIIEMLAKNEKQFNIIRYEIAIGKDRITDQFAILDEKVWLKNSGTIEHIQRSLFPMNPILTETLISKGSKNIFGTVKKIPRGNDYFVTEIYEGKTKGKSWQYAFKLGTQKSALGSLPADENAFPATTWLRNLLIEGVQSFILNSLEIRRASPPIKNRGFKPDGSNLPWVIEDLIKNNQEKYNDWISHLQTALPDIVGIRTVERGDDRYRYLLIKYKGGIELPSWVVSDGTLRLLALTLPAYLDLKGGIYLIEEPENGIHPRAIETVYQSLSSVYDAQILMATHSPVLLGIADAKNVLCFAKTQEGVTDIVAGNLHPALTKWQGETTLGELFASGVLG